MKKFDRSHVLNVNKHTFFMVFFTMCARSNNFSIQCFKIRTILECNHFHLEQKETKNTFFIKFIRLKKVESLENLFVYSIGTKLGNMLSGIYLKHPNVLNKHKVRFLSDDKLFVGRTFFILKLRRRFVGYC